MAWQDAQQYCRINYDDLATIENLTDISMLKPGFAYSWAWIGLHDDPNSWKYNMGNDSNSWRWSATGETSKTGYKTWISSNPDNYDANEYCVAMLFGSWLDANCLTLHPFICYNGKKQFEYTELI